MGVSSQHGSLPEWRRLMHCREAEETRAYVRAGFGEDLRFEPARGQRGRSDVRIDGVDLPRMLIHHVTSAIASEIQGSVADTNLVMVLPTHGCLEMSAGECDVMCDRYSAFIFPSTMPATHRHDAPAAELCLRLRRTEITRHLAALAGEPVHAPLELAPTMDLSKGYGRSFASYLHLAVTDFKRTASHWNPIMIGSFEDLIISKLLLSHPHNYSTALQRAEKRIAPRDVKRAIDYMQARLGSPISIADIAETCGIAGRTLFKHFQDFHGISPMQYVRNARFEKARQALAHAELGESVTEIAMRWGFSHMGRFSVEYRQRFGESPGESLRRSRDRS
jgi:AraC-like DNA-binding protein